MKTRSMVLLAAVTLAAHAAQAAPGCSQKVEQLLQSRGLAALASLFKATSPALEQDLQALDVQVGQLSNMAQANGPRFRDFRRFSVKVADLPADYGYVGLWINGESSRLGPVQIHMAIDPVSDCRLLAVNLDHQVPMTEKSK